ncbi:MULTISPECIES: MFS transporter [Peribacillus]|uniref:MFS transporter n=1 Tax=Peribacillus TaxID=2675229 RepID=UPI001913169B|nr:MULTISPECIES: MFS transporter [unclassified Peribacillus]MBK5441670.1 MFS transporter [Peribacillus sp. TH24]MBK5483074.1 MFS transporter [Peribacillus sp. TH16]MBK5501812.1 MFS transporter [Peribacillus sp. TH14]WMX53268.1 MFS transporter [Peribacillus sp. R9-11]
MQAYATNKKRKTIIIILLFIGMTLSYIDKASINVAIIPIQKELQLNSLESGFVLSIFFFSYAFMHLLGGWLTDKYGSRKVLVLSILAFSLFTTFTSFAWSFASLLLFRFLFGIGEGSVFPASIRSISDNFPENERGRASSFFLSAQTFGGAIGSVTIGVLVVSLGWRSMFVSIGIIGVLVAWAFWVYLKSPADAQINNEKQNQKKVSYKKVFKTNNFWKLFFTKFFSNIVNWGMISWMPSYLVNKGLDLLSVSALMSIPYLASFLMFNVNGWILDKYMSGREKYLAVAGSISSGVFLYMMFNATSVTLGIVYMTFNAISIAFIGTSLYTMVIKYSPKELTGSVTGLVSFGGQIAGGISPVVIGFVLTLFKGSYNAASWFLITAALAGAIASITIKNKVKETKEDVLIEHSF